MTDNGRHPHRHGLPRISRKITGRVYVVHLDKPLGGPKHQAQHYTGTTKLPKTAQERLADHKDGKPGSAAILRAANERGIDYHIVRDWPGNAHIENQLKLHSAARVCPECTPGAKVPRIVQAAIKAEKRQTRRAARKEAQRVAGLAEAAARPRLNPYEDGRRMARQWLATQTVPGRCADQIEAAHEYVTGPWHEMPQHGPADIDRHRGYTDQIRGALELLREYEAETPEEERGDPGPGVGEQEEEMDEDRDTWLARDGGQVVEVDTGTGYPGRAASPDDGRPVAMASERERSPQLVAESELEAG